MQRISDSLNRNSLDIALLAAWIAMCGSLYFSEVKGYVPCTLCWYQRILMYPLTVLIAVGLLRRDWYLPYYVLPFSLIGLGTSTYHYLLEKTDIFAGSTVCSQGISCTTQWINWFGFVTIPFLALIAFLIISIMSVIAILSGEPVGVDEEGDPLRTPWLRVLTPVVAVLAVFAVLFISGTPAQTAASSTANVAAGAQVQSVQANYDPATLALGDRLYRESCAACHGLEAKGVANLGNQLAGADFVSSKSDAELLDVIVKGRDLNDPENTTGLVMPRVAADPILVTRTCWPSSPLCARSLSARIPIKESPFVSTPITAIAHNASAAALYGVYLAGLRSTYGREYTTPVVHPAAVGGRRRKAQHSG